MSSAANADLAVLRLSTRSLRWLHAALAEAVGYDSRGVIGYSEMVDAILAELAKR